MKAFFCSKQFAWLLSLALLSETLDSKVESRKEELASENSDEDESSLQTVQQVDFYWFNLGAGRRRG